MEVLLLIKIETSIKEDKTKNLQHDLKANNDLPLDERFPNSERKRTPRRETAIIL